jgi:RAD51-like protein 2
VPGIGKTQLAIQLAVDVQIPEAFQGVGGEAIYIDTEGSFMVERALQMGASVMKHLSSIAKHHARPAQVEAAAALAGLGDGGRAFLRGVHVMRCHDQAELLATVHHLPALLQQHPKGKSRGRSAAPAVQNHGMRGPCFWSIPVPLD